MTARRLTLILLAGSLLLAPPAAGREVVVLDASPSVARRDPDRLTHTAAWAVALAVPADATVDLYDERGDLFASSRGRDSESSRVMLGDALERLVAAGAAAGGGDLVLALERILERERAREPGEDRAARVVVATDGRPSLTLERWESEYGVPAERLEADPTGWQRLCENAHDLRLAGLVDALGALGVAVSWIAPAGAAPRPVTSHAIQASGGWALAGGGLADIETMLERLAPSGGSILPLSAEGQVISVPPGATRLELLYLKPGRDPGALQLGAPGGASSRLLGLGALAGLEVVRDPPAGRWSVRRGDGGRPGLVRVTVAASLQLRVSDALTRPGLPGELRTAWIDLCDARGEVVPLRDLDRARVTLALHGGDPMLLRTYDDRFQAPFALLQEPGDLHAVVRAELACGDWRAELEHESTIPVADPSLEVTGLPDLALTGSTLSISVRVLEGDRSLDVTGARLTLSGLSATPLALEPRAGRLAAQVIAPAGASAWTIAGEVEVRDGVVMPVSAAGELAAGNVEVSLEGVVVGEGDQRDRWSGDLVVCSTVPAALDLLVTAREEGGSARGLPTGTVPPGGELRQRISLPPPARAGLTRTRITVAVVGLEDVGLERLVEVHAPTWWQRHARTVATIGAAVLAGLALAGWLLGRRPFLQGELSVCDLSGRPVAASCDLGDERRHLGRRAAVVAPRSDADLEVPAELAWPGLRLVLRPRAADLGIVLAELENAGTATVRVGDEAVAPGQRRLLAHADVIEVGKAHVVYNHPLAAHVQVSR